jgi:hypothetical protein
MKWKLFAIAPDIPDLALAREVLAAAGVEMTAEGSRTRGCSLCVDDPDRARNAISCSHRFRTGDLRLFLLQYPRLLSQPMHPDDVRGFWEWRRSLTARDRIIEAPLSPVGRDT